jgi:hypothetical protein
LLLCLTIASVVFPSFAEDSAASLAEKTVRSACDGMLTRQRSGGWGRQWTEKDAFMWGEFKIIPREWITVQPPATPGVASAMLRAGQLLNEPRYLRAAREARDALAAIQTAEGGFPYEANPAGLKITRATFDDDTTTGALDFLFRLYEHSRDDADRAMIVRVGEFILAAQYPNGGWPQEYPPRKDTYKRCITFNDNAMINVMRALFRLRNLLHDDRYYQAAVRGGECILKLQGGPGEEIWAAQYDPDTLRPAWARYFEPPSYSSAESRSICSLLIDVYLETGQDRFLEPLPRAFQWYDAHRLPNGKWARFYEVDTKRPVYGRRDKPEPVYEFEKATGGYSWQGDWFPYEAKQALDQLRQVGREEFIKSRQQKHAHKPDEAKVRQICGQLDCAGYWFSEFTDEDRRDMLRKDELAPGERLVDSEVFCRNINVLLDYLSGENP